MLQPRTLGVHPVFELRRPADEEPIEERSRIRSDRPFGIAASQRVLEGLRVAREHIQVQP